MIGTLEQWQRGQIERPSNLPDGVRASPAGYFQSLSIERPYYTDPNNPGGSRNYGQQRVAAPVLGTTESGMRYYASFAGYDDNGQMLWDFSRPSLGQPDMNWTPTLDPYVQAEQERNANPDPLGRGPAPGGTFTDPRTLGQNQPPTTAPPPSQPPTGGLLGPGAKPPPMAEPVDPITGGPRVPLPNEPVLPPGSVFMPPPNGQPPSGGQSPGGQPQGGNGLYASFGYAPGPAGGLLPIMLGQGMNPFQNQQPSSFSPRAPQYTHPTQLARALFNPDIQGYQWFQPPPTEGATANPNQPPTGSTPPGTGMPPNYNGGFDPNTGRYFELMKSQGLLGGAAQTPAALRGLLS